MSEYFRYFTVSTFQKKNKGDKDQLYNRIADSYVALFTSINQDVKDKFLMVSSTVKPVLRDHMKQEIFLAFQTGGCLFTA